MKSPVLEAQRFEKDFKECGATALYLFGSRARGDHRPDSDIDLFIDYDVTAKIPSFFRIMALESKIEETTGVPVHITTRDSLHPLARAKIERDAIRLF